MAGSQVATSTTIISSLLGFQAISLTNMDSSAEPQVAAGSKVEIASAFFTFASDESITNWSAIATASTAYIALTPSGAAGSQTVSAAWTETDPVWSTSKQGWYQSAGSTIRYIGLVRKGESGLYVNKTVFAGKSDALWPKTTMPVLVGPMHGPFVLTNNGRPAVAALNEHDIAHINVTDNKLSRFTSSDGEWLLSGTALTIPAVTSKVGLAALSSTLCALINWSGDLTAFTWNGATWATTGSVLSIGSVGEPDICALNSTTVAIATAGIDALKTFSWNGAAWSTMGSALSLGSVIAPSLAMLTASTVSLLNPSDLAKYSWDGSNWATVGNAYTFEDLGYTSQARLSDNMVLIVDGQGGKTDHWKTMAFDGTNWARLDMPQLNGLYTTLSGAYPALTMLSDGRTIAWTDDFNDRLYSHRVRWM